MEQVLAAATIKMVEPLQSKVVRLKPMGVKKQRVLVEDIMHIAVQILPFMTVIS